MQNEEMTTTDWNGDLLEVVDWLYENFRVFPDMPKEDLLVCLDEDRVGAIRAMHMEMRVRTIAKKYSTNPLLNEMLRHDKESGELWNAGVSA